MFVGHEQIEMRKYFLNLGRPAIVGIVVGVERGRESGGFGFAEDLLETGLNRTLQKVRRDVQVLRVEDIFQIEVGEAVVGHGAGVRQDVAFLPLRKDDGEAGDFSVKFFDAR